VIIIIIITYYYYYYIVLHSCIVVCTYCQEGAIRGYIPPAVDNSLCMLKTPLRFLSRYVDEMLRVLDPFLTDRSGLLWMIMLLITEAASWLLSLMLL